MIFNLNKELVENHVLNVQALMHNKINCIKYITYVKNTIVFILGHNRIIRNTSHSVSALLYYNNQC